MTVDLAGSTAAAGGPARHPGLDIRRRDAAPRPEIEQSWRRCEAIGLTPRPASLPFLYDERSDTRLIRAAAPVLDRLADQLRTSPTTILLADREATIVDRRAGRRELMSKLDRLHVAPGFCFAEEFAGTNGLGTTLEERSPFVVRGEEHLMESLHSLGCVGAPIIHPVKRSVAGILDITCEASDVSELMAPLVANAVRDIETRLFESSTQGEQRLLQEYMRSCRRGNPAVLAMSGDTVIATPTASRIMDSTDQLLIWDWITNHLATRMIADGRLRLSGGTEVRVQARRAGELGDPLTAVLELRPLFIPAARASGSCAGSDEPSSRVGYGVEVRERLPGRSAATYRLQEELDEIAGTVRPVLLTGESGAGRTHVARYLQRRWGNREAVVVASAAASESTDVSRLIDIVAQGGAVILTELDQTDPSVAPTVQRLLSAAVVSSAALIATGAQEALDDNAARLRAHFRQRLSIAPLRHRIEELPDLARQLMAEHLPDRPTPRLQPAAHRALAAHRWPGNVRELDSVLSSAVTRSMGFDIRLEDLPPEYRSPGSNRQMTAMERLEHDAIARALEETDGNKSLAADRLGIARSTLYRKIRALGLESGRFSP